MRLRLGAAGPVLLGVALSGCSALGGKPDPVCRPLEVKELPALGALRGAWMDDERFVVTDLHQSRLLVYDTSRGLEQIVHGWDTEDVSLTYQWPMDIRPWGRGFVLVDLPGKPPSRLLELDGELRPVRVAWKGDGEPTDGGWEGTEVINVFELAVLGDKLFLQAERPKSASLPGRVYVELGTGSGSGSGRGESALGELAAWPGFEGERDSPGMVLRHLAAVGRSTGSVFALRYSNAPFIQELAGEGRRLKAFPELPAPLPTLPQASSSDRSAYNAAIEASSYPAGLYADEDSLYVLMRDATGDRPAWDLHRIHPERDEVVGRLRLPTNAVHVKLLPGRRFWALEESGSGVDTFRTPTRLLLLSSAAIRAGEVTSCD